MTKKKKVNEPERHELTSGVTVIVRPFPAGLFEKVQARGLREYPDPIPPKKTITVLDGTEEVDDLDDPDYKEEVALSERKRNELLGEAVYDLCVEIEGGLDPWEPTIKKLEKYQGPFPEDPEDRKLEFLTSFGLSTAGDYELVMTSAVSQTLITDPEVADRLQSFQPKVEGAASINSETSGADGNQRMAIQSAFPGA